MQTLNTQLVDFYPSGLQSLSIPAVVSSGRTFDCSRFQQAVECIVLDFVLTASLYVGWPATQHGCYWLTLCPAMFSLASNPALPGLSQALIGWLIRSLESSYQDGLNEYRCGLSWSIVHAFPGRHLVLGDEAPQCTQSMSMLDEQLAGSLLFPEFVPHRNPVWAAGGNCASGSMVWPCVSHNPPTPPCHATRRRAVSWLSSCHTWMMLLRLGVWQWLALVTITIGTSFPILLVQKVRVLEIGSRLIFPLLLLSCCDIYSTAPFMFLSTLLSLWHVSHSLLLTSWYLLCLQPFLHR